jgi:hypothetical protein
VSGLQGFLVDGESPAGPSVSTILATRWKSGVQHRRSRPTNVSLQPGRVTAVEGRAGILSGNGVRVTTEPDGF